MKIKLSDKDLVCLSCRMSIKKGSKYVVHESVIVCKNCAFRIIRNQIDDLNDIKLELCMGT